MKHLAHILFVLLFMGCVSKERSELTNQIKALKTEIDSLHTVVDSLSAHKPELELAFWEFAEKAIDNPKQYISQALRAKPNLIPLEPVLGGSMHFSRIIVLTDNWVIAHYEDGHIRGKSLYRYELQQDTTLIFDRLFSVPSD